MKNIIVEEKVSSEKAGLQKNAKIPATFPAEFLVLRFSLSSGRRYNRVNKGVSQRREGFSLL